jgi:hypothetical protein
VAALGKAYIEVRADLAAFPADLRAKLEAAFKEATAGIKFEDLDKKVAQEGEVAADKMADSFDKESSKRMKASGEKSGRSFFSGLKGIFPLLMSSFLPVLIALAVEVGSYLLPAVAALGAAIPAAASIAIGAFAALAVATHGVGDAIKAAFSGDPAKLAQAMAKLSPAAREFVTEISKARPALHALQQDVQQVFFVQLEGSITRLTSSLLPTLRSGLHDVAGDIGGIGRGIIDAIISHKEDIASTFLGVHYSLQDLVPVLGRLIGSFITLTAVAGPFVEKLVHGLAVGMGELADMIEGAAANGGLAGFFDAAYVILQNLGGLLVQVAGLFEAITSAASGAGGQALGVLTAILGELNAFFSSTAGAQALGAIFILLNTVLSALAQVLTPLLPAIGAFAGQLAGQLTTSVVALTPSLVQLSGALAQMLMDATNLLPVISQIAIGLAPMISALAAHPKLLEAAAVAWGVYAAAVKIADMWQAVFIAEEAASPFGLFVLAIAAVVIGLALLIANWKTVEHWASVAWGAIMSGASAFWGWIKTAGGAIAGVFMAIIQWFADLPGRALGYLLALPGMIVSMIFSMGEAVAEALGFAIGLWLGILINLPGWVWNALLALPGIFVSVWNTAFEATWGFLQRLGSAVGDFFIALPGRIWGWISSIPGVVGRAFQSAWDNARSATERGANAVVAFAKSLPGRLSGLFSDAGSAILSGLKSGINGVIRAFNRGIDHAAGPLHVILPHIPQLAAGALIGSPTLAVIGEAGPEAVIPLSNPARARQLADESGLTKLLQRGEPGVTVNVTAVLGTGEILTVLDQRVEQKMGEEADSLGSGERTGGF